MAALNVRITGKVHVEVSLDEERWVSLGLIPVTFRLVSPDVDEEMEAGMLRAVDGAVVVRLNPSNQMSVTLSEDVLVDLLADGLVDEMRGLLG